MIIKNENHLYMTLQVMRHQMRANKNTHQANMTLRDSGMYQVFGESRYSM